MLSFRRQTQLTLTFMLQSYLSNFACNLAVIIALKKRAFCKKMLKRVCAGYATTLNVYISPC
jgi:hypothetical protein